MKEPPPQGQVSSFPLSDEKIFEWEYLETLQQEPKKGDEETQAYNKYKNLKSRYIFEVTNWF